MVLEGRRKRRKRVGAVLEEGGRRKEASWRELQLGRRKRVGAYSLRKEEEEEDTRERGA